MTQITYSKSSQDLQGILDLQLENHLTTLSAEEKESQGFVTVRHTYEQLEEMNTIAPHIIAKNENEVVGYILAMTKASRSLIPVLIPMFDQFDKVLYNGKSVSEYEYMVVGQVCVGKSQRGKGLFDQMYQAYQQAFQSSYDFAITEIALSNVRSLAAHHRVGFEIIHQFEDETQAWAIVAWDWKKNLEQVREG
jgi:L-amino acid N-acyltransferase YncA